jgi:hypothetical protein
MSLDPTPISAVSDAAGKLFDLVRLSLPSDAVRLQQFKDREPLRYLRIRHRVEMKMYKQILHETKPPVTGEEIGDFVKWDETPLPQSEKDDLVAVLKIRFNIK